MSSIIVEWEMDGRYMPRTYAWQPWITTYVTYYESGCEK